MIFKSWIGIFSVSWNDVTEREVTENSYIKKIRAFNFILLRNYSPKKKLLDSLPMYPILRLNFPIPY